MNKILLCLAFMGSTLVASSQKIYFIYVQAESGQAFYLKMNEKLFSSTASGYLILPKLRDTTYSFSIGFPGNKWPDQRFTVSMERKDRGYLLKNFGDKGWGLFDLQTLAVLMAAQSEVKKDGAGKTENNDASAFTNVLAKAADDPSLKEKPVQLKPEESKTAAIKESADKNPVVAKTEVIGKPADDPSLKEKPSPSKTEEPKTEAVQESSEKTPAVTTEAVSKPADDPSAKQKTAEPIPEEPKTVLVSKPEDKVPVIVTKSETVKEEPKITAPVVKENNMRDQPKDSAGIKTETTEMPKEQEVKTKEELVIVSQQPSENEKITEYKVSVVTRRSESSTTEGFGLTFTDLYGDGMADTIRILIPNPKPVVVPVTEKQEMKGERKFLDTDSVAASTKEFKADPGKPEETPAVNAIVKNNCTAVADNNDFLRIRKKMAAETSDDNMIAEAKKIFKAKCFSTLQIKNLGLLFLNDEGKYKFFDAAYSYVSDPGNYPSLESELKDAYYINRFKAMLRL